MLKLIRYPVASGNPTVHRILFHLHIGCQQREGIDYTDTCASVAGNETLLTFLNVVAEDNLEMVQFDIKTAFLYGQLDTEIWMHQPQGFSDGSLRKGRLRKAIYGLKQAPLAWQNVVKSLMFSMDFTQSTNDPNLYLKPDVYVLLYVDDALVASKSLDCAKACVSEVSVVLCRVNKGMSGIFVQYCRLQQLFCPLLQACPGC
jgi:hypothetical protein